MPAAAATATTTCGANTTTTREIRKWNRSLCERRRETATTTDALSVTNWCTHRVADQVGFTINAAHRYTSHLGAHTCAIHLGAHTCTDSGAFCGADNLSTDYFGTDLRCPDHRGSDPSPGAPHNVDPWQLVSHLVDSCSAPICPLENAIFYLKKMLCDMIDHTVLNWWNPLHIDR